MNRRHLSESAPARRSPLARAALALAVWAAAAAPAPLAAGETDQYLAWGAELDDSSAVVNRFVNEGIEVTLERLRRPEELACEELPPRIYRYLFHGLLRSRLRHYLDATPEVDRFPADEVGYFRYLGDSLFRSPHFPFLMPMARTIRIDGVHLGIDKVNHLFGFGRRYYNRYRRARARGLGEEEAVRRTVVWGLRVERFFVGGLVDGIVSYADLEANYQGMRLARDLCEASPPHLELSGGRWRLARPVDLAAYVNPRFDESYNPSRFTGWRWPQVRRVLERDVCPRLAEPAVQARWTQYRLADRPSRAERILAREIPEHRWEKRRAQSLEAVCPPELAAHIAAPERQLLSAR